ncbi:hypothetical protein AtNW77_Chr3g0194201 [Arabidopsis thaliana]
MGPPPPVITSPSSRFGVEKTGQSANPRHEESEPRDANPKPKAVENSELNDMIEYYERLLLDREHDGIAWKDKFSSLESDLHSCTEVKQKLEDQLDNFSSELMMSNGELQDQYQRYEKI